MEEQVDWSSSETDSPGYLWTYNLHYFEYLESLATLAEQAENAADRKAALNRARQLIDDWIVHHRYPAEPGWAPYPLSLRLVYWSRFLARFPMTQTQDIRRSMYEQMRVLWRNVEYDLANNHILENLIGVLFAASLYEPTAQINRLRSKASAALRRELNEQLTPSGILVERSAMYHAIILSRLLMLRPLQTAGLCDVPELDAILTRMAGHVQRYTLPDGTLLNLNDSAEGVAPPTVRLLDALRDAGLPVDSPPTAPYAQLDDAGVFTCIHPHYRCDVDCAGPMPPGNPAHAHAAIGSFVLYWQGRPLIVDPGCSTYEAGPQRAWERSTRAHNAVSVDGADQSEMWGQFRIGRRARAKCEALHAGPLPAVLIGHDGYTKQSGSGRLDRKVKFCAAGIEIVDLWHSRENHTLGLLLAFAPQLSLRSSTEEGPRLCRVAIRDASDRLVAQLCTNWQVEHTSTTIATAFGVREEVAALRLWVETGGDWHGFITIGDVVPTVTRK